MAFLKRLVMEVREVCPPPFRLSIKLNEGNYMAERRLSADEMLKQVKWLRDGRLCEDFRRECGAVDFQFT